MLGDGMVIYRVWVVYSRNYWVLILPILSYIGTTVASIMSVVFIGKASGADTPFYLPSLEIWLPAFFALTFATSVLCSLLIAGRLWYIRKRVQIHRTLDTLTTVLRIVIESASIYSLTMLVYLITYTAKSNTSIIFGDMVSPVIGIAFSLITIRVHNAFNPDNYNTSAGNLDRTPPSSEPKPRTPRRYIESPPERGHRLSRIHHNHNQPIGLGQSFTVSIGPLSDPYPLTLDDSMRSYTDGTGSAFDGDGDIDRDTDRGGDVISSLEQGVKKP